MPQSLTAIRPTIVAFGLSIAVALTSCGTTTLDMTKLSKLMTDNVTKALPESADVGAVTCPKASDVKVQTGGKFECTIKVDGQDGRLEVTQNDEKGNVDFVPLDAFLIVSKIEGEIATGIKEQTEIDATIDCGANGRATLIKAPGDVFNCTATASDGSGTVEVTVKDTEGNVEWKLVE
jgi:hypothetical protein